MIKDRWDERLAFLSVDVVRKDGCTDNASSTASKARCVSSVTNEPSDVMIMLKGVVIPTASSLYLLNNL
jgi:hypothetical protein